MKYLVMECHPGYAVVLSQDGRYLKAANLNYDVGETVCDIIIMEPKKKFGVKHILSLLAVAIVLTAGVFAGWYYAVVPVGTIRMTINPEVCIEVNRLNYAVGLEGLNEDGMKLIDDQSFLFKKSEELADELIEQAYKLEYLNDGDAILISVSSESENWKANTENRLLDTLKTWSVRIYRRL